MQVEQVRREDGEDRLTDFEEALNRFQDTLNLLESVRQGFGNNPIESNFRHVKMLIEKLEQFANKHNKYRRVIGEIETDMNALGVNDAIAFKEVLESIRVRISRLKRCQNELEGICRNPLMFFDRCLLASSGYLSADSVWLSTEEDQDHWSDDNPIEITEIYLEGFYPNDPPNEESDEESGQDN